MYKATSMKQIEKLIKEKNLCKIYFKNGSYYYAFETLELYKNAYLKIKNK